MKLGRNRNHEPIDQYDIAEPRPIRFEPAEGSAELQPLHTSLTGALGAYLVDPRSPDAIGSESVAPEPPSLVPPLPAPPSLVATDSTSATMIQEPPMTEPMYYVSLGDEAPVDCPPPAPVPLQLRDEPVIRAVQFEAPEVATSGPAAFAPEMQWEPRTQPEMPTSEFEPVAAVTQARSIEAVPDVSMAAPADSFEHLMARLSRSRDVMRDAQVYCNGIADEIAATVESFGIAAAHLRSVGREQGELQTLMDAAITNLHHINDHFEAQHVSAATEAAGMIERAAAEADSLRASAMADVERTRERLVRFTAEIGSVATELRGGGVARAS